MHGRPELDGVSTETPEGRAPAQGHALRGVILAFTGAVCWGFSASCVSWLSTNVQVDIMWLTNMRVLCTGIVFTVVACIAYRPQIKWLFTNRALVLQLLFHVVVGVILAQSSYMYAIAYTNPGTALLLQAMGVPIILVVACVRARRLPTPVEALALALAIGGTAIIATQGDFTSLAISPLGLFWGLVSAVALAGYNLIPERLIKECGSVVTNGFAMLIASLVITPLVRPVSTAPALDATGLFCLFGVVVIGTMVAYFAYLKGVAEAGPVKASFVGVFEPVSGAVFAALWLGTAFTMWDLIGGAAIIAMMLIIAAQK